MADPITGNKQPNALDGTSGDDVILGLGGDDTLRGLEGDDELNGGDDNDTLIGGNGIDTLKGGDGDDILNGGGGDLVHLTSEHPSDLLIGGRGTDTMLLSYRGFIINNDPNVPAAVTVDISNGDGEVVVSGLRGENFSSIEKLVFDGPDGNDIVTGGSAADFINGSGGNDTLKGGGGADTIGDSWGFINADGGPGSDLFQLDRDVSNHFDAQNAAIDGNAGTITVGGASQGTFSSFEALNITAGHGDDTIVGVLNGTNTLNGGQGNDTITGGNKDDTLIGTTGDDHLTGGGGADSFDGGDGNNTIDGGAGNDTVTLDSVRNTVHAGLNDDLVEIHYESIAAIKGSVLDGGGGNDTLRLNLDSGANLTFANATVQGFETLDADNYFFGLHYTLTMTTAQFSQFKTIDAAHISEFLTIKLADSSDVTMTPVADFRALQLGDGGQTVNLAGVTEMLAEIDGGKGADAILGGSVTTRAFLGQGADRYTGATGNSTISGEQGNDVLTGGGGADSFNGGAGADSLKGGGGADKFVYSTVSDSTSVHFDTIRQFDADTAKFDFTFAVGGVDTAVTTGSLTKATFDQNLHDAIGAAKLGAHHAVLFTASAGGETGHTFLIVDANGTAGYQAGQDYVIALTGAVHLDHLAPTNFV